MASLANLMIPLFSLTLMLLHAPAPAVCDDLGAGLSPGHRTHIVLLRPPPLAGSYEPRLIHTYTEVFTGFAVRLTEDDLAVVSQRKEFLRAFPDHLWHPSTTHTPKFLGLEKDAGLWRDTNYGQGVIIGVLDTGIYAEHPRNPRAYDSGDDTGHGTHTSSTAAGNFVSHASAHGLGRGTVLHMHTWPCTGCA
ncbi:unnamed protein product [Triticum turgidum subsp. durum]|uniref:Inhibitor I9 domain-containing protein n=1 Tax=Triticum turgidum subsp. durum TaxID=4567 RepID=A0A9R0Q880_TRITD|nr:unnamed protein product [Triticum turgidum subsp. durum]